MKKLAVLSLLALVACSRGASHDDSPDAASSAAPAVRLVAASGARASFTRTLARIDVGDRAFSLGVEQLRRGDRALTLDPARAPLGSEEVTLDRGHGVTEWWKKKGADLEVGWTIKERPLDGPGALTVPLVLDGVDVEVHDTALLLRRDGAFIARLDGLEVRDARGERIDARFATIDGAPAIAVDDAAATYPLTIDPILGVLTQFVPSAPGKGYARRVAIDGDTAVVTTFWSATPVIYEARIYRRASGAWSLEKTFSSTRNNYSDFVSLSGNALIVGDVLYDRTSGSWVEVATLPSWLNAVSGNTLFVANQTVSPSYLNIWTRGSSGWASAGTLATGIPHAIAFKGSTLAVGTRTSSTGSDSIGAVKVYTGSGTTWTLRSTLTPITGDTHFAGPDSGQHLAVTDDTIAIVADTPGTGGGWPALYLGSPLGTSSSLQRFELSAMASQVTLAASNGLVLAGFPATDTDGKTDSGAVQVYARTGSTWSYRDKFIAPIRINYDNFGGHVSLSGEDALIAAPGYTAGGSTMITGMAFELYPVLAWPNGHACTNNGSCASGNCVDGVCCNSPCTESCKACNLTGTAGTCANVPADSMPVGTRMCAPAKRCAAGGVCATTCTTSADCASGIACIAGKCEGKRGNGSPCTAAGDCTSNFCVDSVCCNSACTSQCMACDVPTKQGTCWNVTGAPHGARAACTGTGAGSECGPTCDGSDGAKCNYLAAGTVACGSDACNPTTLIETRKGTCNGAGVCSGGSVSCGAYACGPTTCKTSCDSSTDCAKGYVCGTDKLCKAISTLGVACTMASDCESPLTCVDGVCCAESSCPSGSSCNQAGSKGQCKKNLGSPCGSALECASGRFCADGVCCDKACNGTCEACDVDGKRGTCSPVLGAPRATHPPCTSGDGVCAAKQCDGNARTTCEAFATPKGTECSPASCVEGGVQPKSTCDGAGGCLKPSVQKCGNYVCAEGACKTSCAKTEDCAAGFVCGPDGRCVEGARCSDDGLSSIAKSGASSSCAPYRCGESGLCSNTCKTTADCAPGNSCDTAAGICLGAPVPSEDDGGCAFGHGQRGAFGLSALALAAILIGRRRRAA